MKHAKKLAVLTLVSVGLYCLTLGVGIRRAEAVGSYDFTFTKYSNCETKAVETTQPYTLNYVGGKTEYDVEFPNWECGKITLDAPNSDIVGVPPWGPDAVFYAVGDFGPDGHVDYLEFNHFELGTMLTNFNNVDPATVNFIHPSYVGFRVSPMSGGTDCTVGTWGAKLKDPHDRLVNIWYGCSDVLLTTVNGGDVKSINQITGQDIAVTEIISGVSYRVTLPSITKPDTSVQVHMTLQDDSEATRELIIKRNAVNVDSLFSGRYYPERGMHYEGNPNFVIDWGSEDGQTKAERTFVTYTASNLAPVSNPRLIVNYYNEANGQVSLLGAKQFDPIAGATFNYPEQASGVVITDTLISSSADPSIGILGANKVSVFLVSGDLGGTSSSFGGVKFGVGAGWEELMTNHPEHSTYDSWLNGFGE